MKRALTLSGEFYREKTIKTVYENFSNGSNGLYRL